VRLTRQVKSQPHLLQRQTLLAFKMMIAGFVVFFVVAVLAPLFLFTPQLARASAKVSRNMAPLPLRTSWILIKMVAKQSQRRTAAGDW